MQYIITGNCRGQKITKTATSDFLAFTIIRQLSHDGITDIGMKEVKQEEPKGLPVPEQKEVPSTQGLKRIRTIPQIMAYLRAVDPESCISEHYLRKLVKTKPEEIGAFKSGSKNMINLDILMEHLNRGFVEADPDTLQRSGAIRKVSE